MLTKFKFYISHGCYIVIIFLWRIRRLPKSRNETAPPWRHHITGVVILCSGEREEKVDGGSHNNKVLLSPKALKLALIRRERRRRVSARIHAAAMADRAGFIWAMIRPLTEKKGGTLITGRRRDGLWVLFHLTRETGEGSETWPEIEIYKYLLIEKGGGKRERRAARMTVLLVVDSISRKTYNCSKCDFLNASASK